MRGWAGGAVGLAACAGAVAVRSHRARRAARGPTGTGPFLRADDGVQLHVEVEGPPRAPVTVVFVHGFAARGAAFDPQWAALRGRARLVRFDQRGHGRSGWAGSRTASLDRLGRDLGTVVDELGGVGPVVVVGHSMGGMAVLALAARRPELFGGRIAGVALLSTLAAPLAVAGRDPAGPAAALVAGSRTALASAGARLVWLAAPVLDLLHPLRSAAVQGLLRRRLFAGDEPEAAVQEMTDTWIRTPTAVLAAHLPALARYDQRSAVDALRDVPVLVLSGCEDATIPAAASRQLADRLGPTVRLELVPGAGHMVVLTHAPAVNAALQALLTRAVGAVDDRAAPCRWT